MIFDKIYRDATIEEKYWGRPRREVIFEIREYLGNLRHNCKKSLETEFVTIPRLVAQLVAIQNQVPLEQLSVEDRAYISLHGDLCLDSAEAFKAALARLPDPVSCVRHNKPAVRIACLPRITGYRFEDDPNPRVQYLDFQLFMEIKPEPNLDGQNSPVLVWWQLQGVPVTSPVKVSDEMAKDLKALVGRE